MKMNKTVLTTAVGLALGLASLATYATTVTNSEYLTIATGTETGTASAPTITGGSWFGMDTNKDSKIQQAEADMLSQGTTGLVFGVTTAQGASHSGAPVAGDTNAIDAPWAFFGNTGSDYLKVAVSGSTSGGLNLSGWTVTWNGIPAINMGGGAWQPLNCGAAWMQCSGHTFTNGNAEFTWDGVLGDAYTLNYAATVPAGDPSGFGGVQYYLHLTGVVNKTSVAPVPLPAAVWLLGSGLIGLVGVSRRKRSNQG
ncbi:MAG: VPLPA-CTERM sorting domain-containing protein [Acidiferrobacterales bacterium]